MAITLISNTPKLHDNCIRCGRTLTAQESREVGYGPTCLTKIGDGVVSKRQTRVMREQLHAKATAQQIEELSAKVFKLTDDLEKLKTLRVVMPVAPPSTIPMPPSVNVSVEKVVQPDAQETPQNEHELKLGNQVTFEDLANTLPAIQTEIAELMKKRKAELDRTASKSIGQNVEVKNEQTNGSLESLVMLQDKIKGA